MIKNTKYSVISFIKSVYIFFEEISFKLIPTRQCTRNEIKYKLDLNEVIDFAIYKQGKWEKYTHKFLETFIKKNDIVLEIGANIGAHTLTIAKIIGEKGLVHAFEPSEYAHKKLKKNIELNPSLQTNIILNKKLVSNSKKIILNNQIRSSWLRDKNKLKKQEKLNSNLEIISIDEYVKRNNLKKISMIKIDVDGYDFKVLSGSINTIKKFKPIIFIELSEVCLNKQGDTVSDIYNFLSKLNYKLYCDKTHKLMELKDVYNNLSNISSINGIFIN